MTDGTGSSPFWRMDLETCPAARAMGVGVHGHRPVERYLLDGLWCVHLYRYNGALRVNGVTLPFRPGCVSFVPPDTPLEHHFGEPRCVHLVAHFALPPPEGGPDAGMLVPALQDLGADFPAVQRAFEEAIGSYATRPRRAEARLWDILWQLAERTPVAAAAVNEASPRAHPAVERALRIIELRLGEPLRVAEIADAVGLSHNHLTRLFREGVGDSVVGYIRGRRVRRAAHLLRHSTLPIKAIAAEVGIPDLHRFNKAIRRGLGPSPRQVRRGDG